MIEKLIKNRIEECYNTNEPFKKLLEYRFKTNYKEIVASELNDFILSKNDVYKSNNFMTFIYEAFLELKDGRFTNFLRNMITGHPDADRTYGHMMNDIKDKLDTKYQLSENYYNMSKYELNKECDKLLSEGKYLMLSNTRKYMKDNFKLERYDSFVFENRDLAKVLLKKNNLDETDRVYIRIRELLKNKPGLLGLFTYYNKVEEIGFGRLKTLFHKMTSNDNIISQLQGMETYMPRRGNFRGPFKMEDGRTYNTHFEHLDDELTQLIEGHKAKLFADAYPGSIKKDLDKNSDFIEIIKELTNNSEKSKEKLELYNKFWLNKVSRYKTQEELVDSLTNFVFADSSVEELRRQIENDYNLKLVFDDGELIIVRVLSYDSIQNIGNDTSWCIKDSLSYWTDYVYGQNVQLAIMDFGVPRTSVNRKIGVTLNSNGSLNTAHSINDGYITEADINKILSKVNVSLDDMFDVARDLGSNEEYDDDEVSEDSYGGF